MPARTKQEDQWSKAVVGMVKNPVELGGEREGEREREKERELERTESHKRLQNTSRKREQRQKSNSPTDESPTPQRSAGNFPTENAPHPSVRQEATQLFQ